MLSEVTNLTQHDAGTHRRWFHDEFFDLYVWENFAGEGEGKMQGFQLCYAKADQQRALRWSRERGYNHEGVDSPEDKPGRAMSAIFVADGVFDPDHIAEKFAIESASLPPGVRDFVLEKITGYAPAPISS
jgi:hypothetical protein